MPRESPWAKDPAIPPDVVPLMGELHDIQRARLEAEKQRDSGAIEALKRREKELTEEIAIKQLRSTGQ